MKKLFLIILLAVLVIPITGCSLFRTQDNSADEVIYNESMDQTQELNDYSDDADDSGSDADPSTTEHDVTRNSDGSESEFDDPLVRLRVETSGSTARLWDAALELCELLAGAPLSAAIFHMCVPP